MLIFFFTKINIYKLFIIGVHQSKCDKRSGLYKINQEIKFTKYLKSFLTNWKYK